MAAIQCPGCKANLSVKGLVNCPLCQAYLNPPHHQVVAAAVPAAAAAGRAAHLKGGSIMAAKDWLTLAGLVVIAVAVLLIIYSVVFPPAEELKHRKVMAALTLCQQAIHSVAQYGDADTPPYTQNYGSGDEFYFAWPPGSFHFPNAFGAKVKMSASCLGSVSTGTISQLTINGKDFK